MNKTSVPDEYFCCFVVVSWWNIDAHIPLNILMKSRHAAQLPKHIDRQGEYKVRHGTLAYEVIKLETEYLRIRKISG